MVDFWTYTCINWLRTLPYIRAWAHKYQEHGLVVLGVHTPEFDFEHDLDNVRRAVKDMRGELPGRGRQRLRDLERLRQPLLASAVLRRRGGPDPAPPLRRRRLRAVRDDPSATADRGRGSGIGHDLVSVDAGGVEAAADWDDLRSPENYLGYQRTENFASPDGAVLDTPHAYAVPARLRLNYWGLAGAWTVGRQAVALDQAGGRIAYRFHARDVHLVTAPALRGTPVRFRVRIDGQPPEPRTEAMPTTGATAR